jgi:allantoin racemase
MRICYVVPGAMSQGPMGVTEMRRREGLLQEWAFAGTTVTLVDVANGVKSIESAYEELLAAPGAIDRIRDLEEEGLDAAIIGCFGDPGLEAARELVSMPVVGPGEASLLLGAQLGHRMTILSVFDSLAASHRHQAFRAGVLDKLASVRGLNIPVLELMRNPDATFAQIVETGRRAIEEDRAEVLIFGCMTMSFLGVAPKLSEALGVPVINAAQAALKAAESLVSIKLSHSKKAFPLPPKLQEAKVAATRMRAV